MRNCFTFRNKKLSQFSQCVLDLLSSVLQKATS